ncbi:unnamed protein product [Schistocephalus solidus]|uniref:Uncharacterized protein n=1 Tax=Schistocephalus solidus TaxID=70667 RepID=A0A183T0A6_SCHSO|nr:unnamed protein product [Schistocephalus solidus]
MFNRTVRKSLERMYPNLYQADIHNLPSEVPVHIKVQGHTRPSLEGNGGGWGISTTWFTIWETPFRQGDTKRPESALPDHASVVMSVTVISPATNDVPFVQRFKVPEIKPSETTVNSISSGHRVNGVSPQSPITVITTSNPAPLEPTVAGGSNSMPEQADERGLTPKNTLMHSFRNASPRMKDTTILNKSRVCKYHVTSDPSCSSCDSRISNHTEHINHLVPPGPFRKSSVLRIITFADQLDESST